MKLVQLIYLTAVVIIGCNSNYDQTVTLFDRSFSVTLPQEMKECEGFDSIPDYLTMLYNLKTQKSHLFKGNSSYFSAMIVDTPCENETATFTKFSDEFENIFIQAYPSCVFNEGGDGGNDSFNYRYQSFKLEFTFATYSIFYAISSLDGNLLYLNYLEQSENVEAVKKRGIKIMNSFSLKEG